MLHLHGEAARRPPLPALLQAVLLRVHSAVADGTALAMPPLSGLAPPARARQLPLGGGGHAAARLAAVHRQSLGGRRS